MRTVKSFPKLNRSFLPLASTNAHYLSSKVEEKNWYADKIDFKTIPDLQVQACKKFAERPLFGTRNGMEFDWITYGEFDVEVQKFRTVLDSPPHSMKKGEKLAVISNNRVEWAVAAYGSSSLGVALVPMYEAQLETDWKYIIEDSDSTVVLVSTMEIYEKIKDYPGKVGKVRSILVMNAEVDKPYSYKGSMELAATQPISPAYADLAQDDLSVIIYTSGTTGKPKGVELTHGNCHASITGNAHIFRDHLTSKTHLTFLPWAHVYGLQSELNAGVWNGCQMALVPTREQIVECIGIVKPEIIVSVPALFNRIYDGVFKNVRGESPLKQKLINYALQTARKRNELLEFGKSVSPLLEFKFKLFDKVVFSKIRAKMGGRLEAFAAGGAATSLPVLHFFEDIGVPILEGYGLTETSPIITCSGVDWDLRRLGTVGVPIRDVTVRIIDPATMEELPSDTDGEVTCHGPNVMKHYRNNQEANDEVFFHVGDKRFFRTGDMGRMVEGKFLKITGRIKEKYKLENGKYVVPAPLEDVYGRSPFIAQNFLYGDNRPKNILLIVPDWTEVTAFLKAAKDPSLVELIPHAEKMIIVPGQPAPVLSEEETNSGLAVFDHTAVQEAVSESLTKVGDSTKSYERPYRWQPLASPFTAENQMLTPKMSLRRNNVIKIYESLIEEVYDGSKGYSA